MGPFEMGENPGLFREPKIITEVLKAEGTPPLGREWTQGPRHGAVGSEDGGELQAKRGGRCQKS
jgi:hypothetical protein